MYRHAWRQALKALDSMSALFQNDAKKQVCSLLFLAFRNCGCNRTAGMGAPMNVAERWCSIGSSGCFATAGSGRSSMPVAYQGSAHCGPKHMSKHLPKHDGVSANQRQKKEKKIGSLFFGFRNCAQQYHACSGMVTTKVAEPVGYCIGSGGAGLFLRPLAAETVEHDGSSHCGPQHMSRHMPKRTSTRTSQRKHFFFEPQV